MTKDHLHDLHTSPHPELQKVGHSNRCRHVSRHSKSTFVKMKNRLMFQLLARMKALFFKGKGQLNVRGVLGLIILF